MKPSGPLVVAAWGVLNGALVVLLAALGGDPFVLALYGSAAGLVEVIAVVVLLSRWRSRRWAPGERPARQAAHGDTSLLVAAGVVTAAVGFLFGRWLALAALLPFLAAAAREFSIRRERP